MYGWRGRLGLIVPSSNTTNEPEVVSRLPDGISLYTSRMHLEDVETGALESMADDIEQCSELLASADIDVIMYGCTTGSLVKGAGYDRQIEDRIEEITEVPAVATAASVKRALDALNIERPGIVTPYEEELNAREVEFLESQGYDVAVIDGLQILQNTEIGAQHPETAYRQASDVFESIEQQPDGIFVSCTNYRTFEMIEQLESDTGVPVVTSNQATLWDALTELGVATSEIELGSLFEQA